MATDRSTYTLQIAVSALSAWTLRLLLQFPTPPEPRSMPWGLCNVGIDLPRQTPGGYLCVTKCRGQHVRLGPKLRLRGARAFSSKLGCADSLVRYPTERDFPRARVREHPCCLIYRIRGFACIGSKKHQSIIP